MLLGKALWSTIDEVLRIWWNYVANYYLFLNIQILLVFFSFLFFFWGWRGEWNQCLMLKCKLLIFVTIDLVISLFTRTIIINSGFGIGSVIYHLWNMKCMYSHLQIYFIFFGWKMEGLEKTTTLHCRGWSLETNILSLFSIASGLERKLSKLLYCVIDTCFCIV